MCHPIVTANPAPRGTYYGLAKPTGKQFRLRTVLAGCARLLSGPIAGKRLSVKSSPRLTAPHAGGEKTSMHSPTSHSISRRAALKLLGQAGLLGLLAPLGCTTAPVGSTYRPTPDRKLLSEDDALLEELERTATTFFREAAHPVTGLVLDRKLADGQPDSRTVASIAATGFGLSVLCRAHERGYAPRDELREQVARTLRWLKERQPHYHGFFYHFTHFGTGERVWSCELSSVDSALLFCGVLHARAYFADDAEIVGLATGLFERADWPWFLDGQPTLSMGWKPESGFLKARWDHYCELMLIYLLGLGSPTHPLPAEVWSAWRRPVREEEGERFVWTPAPLFAHQFSQAWFDFRAHRDRGVDWFENSVAATRAHLRWSLRKQAEFPRWSEDLWGVTSSDSAKGYVGWGGPPDTGPLDGTIVPCAAAGSLPFLSEECLRTLHHQRDNHGARIWKRYGFVDAWNPHNDWVNPDVIGIDVGITALMAANLRDGFAWRTLGKDPVTQAGMSRAGLGK
jgi:hypothetical protein